MSSMKAKYGGRCGTCDNTFETGDDIIYKNKAILGCPYCSDVKAVEDATDRRDRKGHSADKKTNAEKTLEIRVKVFKIIDQKPDGSWGVALARFDGESPTEAPFKAGQYFSIVGPLGVLQIDTVVTIAGAWTQNPKWGLQFKAVRPAMLAISESDEGLASFLRQCLPNVGPKRATKMIKEFGRPALIKIIKEEPLRLCSIEGITEDRALDMQQRLLDQGGYLEVQLFGAELGLKQSIISRMIETWGVMAKTIILEDPYRLMELERVGFMTADEVAQKLGIAPHDPRRCTAATLHLLQLNSDRGHTWTTIETLMTEEKEEFKKTKLMREHLEQGVVILTQPWVVSRNRVKLFLPSRVTVTGERVYLYEIERAEGSIAEKLLSMLDMTVDMTADVTEMTEATVKDTRPPPEDALTLACIDEMVASI